MAEALYQLRKKHGLFYNPSEDEILKEAINSKTQAESKIQSYNKGYEVNQK